MTKEKYTGPKVKDTEAFIKKAHWVHGDKYDYSCVDYKNSSTKIKIFCKSHGIFEQKPSNHLGNRQGCPKCGLESSKKSRLKNTEWFIQKSKSVHNNKYDYLNANYKSIFEKVVITCPNHGDFYQAAKNHLDGQGCPQCSSRGAAKKPVEFYISKAKEKHENKYDYSKVKFESVKEKVQIICPDHGPFWQTFDNHINSGKGCILCGHARSKKAQLKDTKWFVEKARVFHGDFYDYSKSEYINQDTPITITCPEHGDFQRTPSKHYCGGYCHECNEIKFREGKLKPVEHFLEKSKEAHDNYYKYDCIDYVDTRTKVEIACPKHGIFLQRPMEHMKGRGCRNCWLDRYGYGVNGYYGTNKPSNLYVLIVGHKFIKIGLSKDVSRRMGVLNKQSSLSVEKVYSIEGKANDLFNLEQFILRKSGLLQHQPKETFNGATECLELEELPNVLEIIETWEKHNEETKA